MRARSSTDWSAIRYEIALQIIGVLMFMNIMLLVALKAQTDDAAAFVPDETVRVSQSGLGKPSEDVLVVFVWRYGFFDLDGRSINVREISERLNEKHREVAMFAPDDLPFARIEQARGELSEVVGDRELTAVGLPPAWQEVFQQWRTRND